MAKKKEKRSVDDYTKRELYELAFDHAGRDVGQEADDPVMAGLERQADGLDIEIVAEKHGDVRAPLAVDRLLAPADAGVVDDVVMDEAGRVEELDERGQEDRLLAPRAEEPGG